MGTFSDGLKLEHAFPVFYNDLHDTGGKQEQQVSPCGHTFPQNDRDLQHTSRQACKRLQDGLIS